MDLIIAIVDDDEEVRDATTELMESYEWDVTAYESSTEFFIELTNGHVPDCAVVDLHLPEMDGVEIMEELSSQNLQLPIIIMAVLADRPLVGRA